MKKRGFGTGKWNGVGGKVEPGETVRAAAVREVFEEIGVTLSTDALEKRAELVFVYEGKPEWDSYCHVFFASTWNENPRESAEMAPQWYSYDALPFGEMWEDDTHWLPVALTAKGARWSFRFNAAGKLIHAQQLATIPMDACGSMECTTTSRSV